MPNEIINSNGPEENNDLKNHLARPIIKIPLGRPMANTPGAQMSTKCS